MKKTFLLHLPEKRHFEIVASLPAGCNIAASYALPDDDVLEDSKISVIVRTDNEEAADYIQKNYSQYIKKVQ